MPMKHTITELLSTRPYVLAPEIYDCISAKCVEACGFEATVLSTSEFANSYGSQISACLRSMILWM